MLSKNILAVGLDPNEILLDSGNLPDFDKQQFEGRPERAISPRTQSLIISTLIIIGCILVYRLVQLQLIRGNEYRIRSEDNNLRIVSLETSRGNILDRNGVLIAWNEPDLGRYYTPDPGFANLLGYLGLPLENSGTSETSLIRVGKTGLEAYYNNLLTGQPGVKTEEIDAKGRVVSENFKILPKAGNELNISIDARLQTELYRQIEQVATTRDFEGGAGGMLNVSTGEVVTLVSFPEVDSIFVSGTSTSREFTKYLIDKRTPLVNRAISGLYAPGSIVKPFIALAALAEGVVTPEKQILSTGSISIPNPYAPEEFSVFKDWKAHGLVDVRHALAVSSNVYFYEIGGGYQNQKGLGIERINNYARAFGLGEKSGIDLPGEISGVVPSPAWKKEIFGTDEWRLGDTYHTAIGQYGFLVTPLQMARGIAALANGGKLVTPMIVKQPPTTTQVSVVVPNRYYQVVREGMRLSTLIGTASMLNVPYVEIAAKTGTAELGTTKARVNSWVTGFFPYDNPRYAFAIVMERGHVGNTINAATVPRGFF